MASAPILSVDSSQASRWPLLVEWEVGLKGVGDWSQGNIEAALRDSQGLGIDRVGQWTLHKWCLLASVTTVFLLGLTFLVFSILTRFAGESMSYYTSDRLRIST